jgi:hypothetical protein
MGNRPLEDKVMRKTTRYGHAARSYEEWLAEQYRQALAALSDADRRALDRSAVVPAPRATASGPRQRGRRSAATS